MRAALGLFNRRPTPVIPAPAPTPPPGGVACESCDADLALGRMGDRVFGWRSSTTTARSSPITRGITHDHCRKRDDGDHSEPSTTTNPCRWIRGRDRGTPAVAVFAVPTTSTPAPVAECAMGDVQDPATGVCMPAPAQGSLPKIQGIPCTGADTGECIGLGEEQQPPPVPASARRALVGPGAHLGGSSRRSARRTTSSLSRRAWRSAAPARLGRPTAPGERR